jgi:hypothetical protein
MCDVVGVVAFPGISMSFDAALRTRVKRLLGGVYLEPDFSELVLALRQRPYGNRLIVELGHFASHREERDRGIITDVTRDFCTAARFTFWSVRNQPVRASRMPPGTREAMAVNLAMIDDVRLRQMSGLKRKRARPVLQTLVAKIADNPDGTCGVVGPITSEERSLLTTLTGILIVRSAFDADELFADFRDALLKNKLLEPSEIDEAKLLSAPLALYAVGRLHHSAVLLRDNTVARLRASGSDGTVQVTGTGKALEEPMGTIDAAFSVFVTGLKVIDHCEGSLTDPSSADWEKPLELSASGKLRVIVP